VIVAALLAAAQDGDWSSYGRDPGGERFSPLDAIKRENVGSLQAAWTFRSHGISG
jgi:glucose dehydrogenase